MVNGFVHTCNIINECPQAAFNTMTQVAEHINEVKKDYETTLLVQVMYVHTLRTSIMLLLSMYIRTYVRMWIT